MKVLIMESTSENKSKHLLIDLFGEMLGKLCYVL